MNHERHRQHAKRTRARAGGLLAGAGGLAVLAACQTTPPGFDNEGFIKYEYFVGGGVDIDWRAPEAGTVYVIERGTGEIIVTRSIEEGETFFIGPEVLQLAREMTEKSNAELQLDLYFVPRDVR